MVRLHCGPLSAFYHDADRDLIDTRSGVLSWLDQLNQALKGHLKGPLEWSEEGEGKVFDLDGGGWDGLRLLALYANRPGLDWPSTLPPILDLDKEWRGAADKNFTGCRFAQVLAPRLWLPADFTFTVRLPLPDGDEVDIGSATVLSDQLRWLNRETLLGEFEALQSWRDLPAPAGCPFVPAAQRGLAEFITATERANAQHVPLLICPPR